MKPTVVIGFYGTTLDNARGRGRWKGWRPTLSILQQEELRVSRLELLVPERGSRHDEAGLAQLLEDAERVSPETEICTHPIALADAWDFEEVYETLHGFARDYRFDVERERYLVHLTTGTHVAQICLFLLTETRFFPAMILESQPPPKDQPSKEKGKPQGRPGSCSLIDLDLSRYDRIARRFEAEQVARSGQLKSGIDTRNARYNALIDRVERVASSSKAPILLGGPTGVGKTQLARRIHRLKAELGQSSGNFVEVNCATLRGDQAMSTLFGHKKGAFTGAIADRRGLLLAADRGVLFLDEIGELGLDEQAMLLSAIEDKRFSPLGSEQIASSDFQLIAGTNRDLRVEVQRGRFRDDLLARLEVWHFSLPPLRERPEDIEPNLDHELDRFARENGRRVTMQRDARTHFLRFATSARGRWLGNFRDLRAAVTRMSTLAPSSLIRLANVEEEIAHLERAWSGSAAPTPDSLEELLGARAEALDEFDRVQLAHVVSVCRQEPTLAAAGRRLFSSSLRKKTSRNDSDRLRKYLARFDLDFTQLRAP